MFGVVFSFFWCCVSGISCGGVPSGWFYCSSWLTVEVVSWFLVFLLRGSVVLVSAIGSWLLTVAASMVLIIDRFAPAFVPRFSGVFGQRLLMFASCGRGLWLLDRFTPHVGQFFGWFSGGFGRWFC